MDNEQYSVNILHKPTKPNGKEWRFYEFGIVCVSPTSNVPTDIAEPINIAPVIQGIIDNELTNKDGFFSYHYSPQEEDVSLDDFLCVDAYGMKCSFQPFLSELKNFGVTDLFGQDLTKCIFRVLKEIGQFIKDNTDKPQAIKNHITSMLDVFGNSQIISAMARISVMRGLEVFYLECRDTIEGYGVAEVESMLLWVGMEECKMISAFTIMPLEMGAISTEVAKHIKPFTDYLYSTEIGKLANDTTLATLYGCDDTPTDETQQDNTLPIPNTRTNRKKGRPNDVFSKYILDRANEDWLLPVLHQLIDGKRGKNAVLPIAASVTMGLITTPTYKAFAVEFGELTSRQNYNKYREASCHNPVDVDSIKQAIKRH